MRTFSYLIALIFLIGSASANRPVSGVVAVSTGPMQAKYLDAAREIGRDLQAGDSVFLNDEVETGRRTQAQVLLKDESVFSISPNSKVVFDEFIYDPLAQTGTLSAQLLGLKAIPFVFLMPHIPIRMRVYLRKLCREIF